LIAEHLRSDRAIYSFSRTNRFIHQLLNPYLYVHNANKKRPRRSALLRAAEHGREGTMRRALKPFNTVRRSKPLAVAARNGHEKIVALLIAAMDRVKLDDRDPNGYSALDLALMEGHSAVVKQLIDAGATPKTTDKTLKRQERAGLSFLTAIKRGFQVLSRHWLRRTSTKRTGRDILLCATHAFIEKLELSSAS
jgi:Ankyrin repeats (3 copies)